MQICTASQLLTRKKTFSNVMRHVTQNTQQLKSQYLALSHKTTKFMYTISAASTKHS